MHHIDEAKQLINQFNMSFIDLKFWLDSEK